MQRSIIATLTLFSIFLLPNSLIAAQPLIQRSGTPYDKCIRYQRKNVSVNGTSVSGGADGVFINTCNVHVAMMFWVRGHNLNVSGACVGLPVRCGDDIGPHAKETAFAYTGVVYVAACKFPDYPVADGSGTSFRCPGDSGKAPSAKRYPWGCNCVDAATGRTVQLAQTISASSRAQAQAEGPQVCRLACDRVIQAQAPPQSAVVNQAAQPTAPACEGGGQQETDLWVKLTYRCTDASTYSQCILDLWRQYGDNGCPGVREQVQEYYCDGQGERPGCQLP